MARVLFWSISLMMALSLIFVWFAPSGENGGPRVQEEDAGEDGEGKGKGR